MLVYQYFQTDVQGGGINSGIEPHRGVTTKMGDDNRDFLEVLRRLGALVQHVRERRQDDGPPLAREYGLELEPRAFVHPTEGRYMSSTPPRRRRRTEPSNDRS